MFCVSLPPLPWETKIFVLGSICSLNLILIFRFADSVEHCEHSPNIGIVTRNTCKEPKWTREHKINYGNKDTQLVIRLFIFYFFCLKKFSHLLIDPRSFYAKNMSTLLLLLLPENKYAYFIVIPLISGEGKRSYILKWTFSHIHIWDKDSYSDTYSKNIYLSLRPYGRRDFKIGGCREHSIFILLRWVCPWIDFKIILQKGLRNKMEGS